jgi:Putative zincin peptidase
MTEPAATAGPDATMSVVRANLIGLGWLPLAAIVTLGPFALRWGGAPLAEQLPGPAALPVVLPLLALAILMHESLHALGFLWFGGVPRARVRLGFQRRTLTPFAACSAPVAAGAYRKAALLPAVVLGGLPAIVGVITGSAGLALWGWAMLALAGGDVAAVWAIRRVPSTSMVLDHPSRVGCQVVGERV